MNYPDSATASAHFKGRLKRLDAAFYQGKSYVHWTFGIAGRKTGWLTQDHHSDLKRSLRELLVRYHLVCPGYCLMPDHAHFLLIGLNARATQLDFIREFSRRWNQQMLPFKFTRQPYDNVLREKDREGEAFAKTIGYILRNPERKALVTDWSHWPFSGCSLPGYDHLDPRKEYFWENFWKGYHQQAD